MKNFFYNHPYHLVTLSPWPILTSLSIFITLISTIMMFNYKNFILLNLGMTTVLLCSYQWWRDITRESTFQGLHTKNIYTLLKSGMFLFIISELLFFISFFWTYFHSSLSPNIEIGSIWPPKNISQFDPYEIPLLNTIILLSSGVTITYSHYSILMNKKFKSLIMLMITIILGLMFTSIQFYEYLMAPFCLSDSIYGSLFFMTTGFHGLHVIIGSLFLLTMFFRMLNNQTSKFHHYGFEAASWYWHFVDVIWIIVYSMIYWWNY
uniref:Cytochrome c oxidase subunit 3 n=1 Tax=Saphonecrus sp. ZJUH 20220015 TaxID=2943460 RepID=A0A9E8K0X2_9HYME|nr:cytochrome c oxidase subunit 3 [Saphonecrus sp. ZJUH 20220015]